MVQSFVWIDIETTTTENDIHYSKHGVDGALLLHIDLVITNSLGNMRHVSSFLIDQDMNEVESELSVYRKKELVDMELLDNLKQGTCFRQYDVETRLCNTIKHHCHDDTLPPMLAGDSVSTVHAILKHHMPRLNELIYHKHYDINTLTRFYSILTGGKELPSHDKVSGSSRSIGIHDEIVKQLKCKGKIESYLSGIING